MNRSILLSLVLVLGILNGIMIESCRKDTQPDKPSYSNGEGEIGPVGGVISVSDQSSPIYGARVEIPPGALSSNTHIRISPVPDDYVFPLDSAVQLVWFEPEGLTFDSPVTLTLPYKGNDLHNAVVYQYDTINEVIEEMPFSTADLTNGMVSCKTNHFSGYGAGDHHLKAILELRYLKSEERLAAIFLIEGWKPHEQAPTNYYLSSIPLTDDFREQYGPFAEDLAQKSEIHSLDTYFHVDVYKGEDLSTILMTVTIRLKRIAKQNKSDKFIISVYKSVGWSDETFIYESKEMGYSEPEQKNLESWLTGFPLILTLDHFDINPTDEYWFTASWYMGIEGGTIPVTYEFTLNNSNNRSKLGDLYTIEPNQIFNTYINKNYWDTTLQPCPGIPSVLYEGREYSTVLIGKQCWLNRNLNVGVIIDPEYGGSNSDGNQTNNGTIEKYCYDNVNPGCQTSGGLYQWGEAMQYSTTEGAQGICPPGWHIPTDAEWKILEGTVDNVYGVGHSVWDKEGFRGSVAGHHLKSNSGWGGYQYYGDDKYGFGALAAGYYNGFIFEDSGSGTYFWSSTQGNFINAAWIRMLKSGEGNNSIKYQIGRDAYIMGWGLSVRCIKDD